MTCEDYEYIEEVSTLGMMITVCGVECHSNALKTVAIMKPDQFEKLNCPELISTTEVEYEPGMFKWKYPHFAITMSELNLGEPNHVFMDLDKVAVVCYDDNVFLCAPEVEDSET